jgi:hypothetical protein
MDEPLTYFFILAESENIFPILFDRKAGRGRAPWNKNKTLFREHRKYARKGKLHPHT